MTFDVSIMTLSLMHMQTDRCFEPASTHVALYLLDNGRVVVSHVTTRVVFCCCKRKSRLKYMYNIHNLPVKFAVSICTGCRDMKDNAKCRKWGDLGYLIIKIRSQI